MSTPTSERWLDRLTQVMNARGATHAQIERDAPVVIYVNGQWQRGQVVVPASVFQNLIQICEQELEDTSFFQLINRSFHLQIAGDPYVLLISRCDDGGQPLPMPPTAPASASGAPAGVAPQARTQPVIPAGNAVSMQSEYAARSTPPPQTPADSSFSPPSVATPSPTREWYYNNAGTSVGPLTTTQMTTLVREGKLANDTLVWNTDLTDWQQAGTTDLRQLFPAQDSKPPSLTESRPATTIKWPAMIAVGGIVVIVLLVANSALQKERMEGMQRSSGSNLKILALATMQYTMDYDEVFPPMQDAGALKAALSPYIRNESHFIHPLTAEPYQPNPWLSHRNINSITADLSQLVMFYENSPTNDMRGVVYCDLFNDTANTATFVSETKWPEIRQRSGIAAQTADRALNSSVHVVLRSFTKKPGTTSALLAKNDYGFQLKNSLPPLLKCTHASIVDELFTKEAVR